MDPVTPTPSTPVQYPEIWAASQALEATFLAEMLKTAGVGAPRESFSGGAGEAAFSSFLTTEYAASMTEAGGIGLAESIYRSLVERGSAR